LAESPGIIDTTATSGLSTYGIMRRSIWKKIASTARSATPREKAIMP
jgi:hypothetical protein